MGFYPTTAHLVEALRQDETEGGQIQQEQNRLREVIIGCGGTEKSAQAAGVPRQFVYGWMQNPRAIPAYTLIKLCRIAGINPLLVFEPLPAFDAADENPASRVNGSGASPAGGGSTSAGRTFSHQLGRWLLGFK